MTTDRTIAFIRSFLGVIASAHNEGMAYANKSYCDGLITMAAIHFVIDFATEQQLKAEVNNVYNKCVDRLRAHS